MHVLMYVYAWCPDVDWCPIPAFPGQARREQETSLLKKYAYFSEVFKMCRLCVINIVMHIVYHKNSNEYGDYKPTFAI